MGVRIPKTSKGSVLGALLVLGLFLLGFGGNQPVHGVAATSMVCITKSKSVLTLNSKKRCDAGQTKLILSPNATPKVCVSKTSNALAYTNCSSKQFKASSVSSRGYLAACVNSRTRAVSWRKTKCPVGTKTVTLLMPEPLVATSVPVTTVAASSNSPNTTSAPTAPNTTVLTVNSTTTSSSSSSSSTSSSSTTVPVTTSSSTTSTTAASTTTTLAQTTTTTVPVTTTTTLAPTTTTTTTTTTLPPTTTTTVPTSPASITYFFSGVNTINQGETTYLWAYYAGTTASVDNGVGAFPNTLAIDVTPSVTTTYTLTVSNGAGSTVTATTTITVIPSGGTTTTTTTVPTGTTTSTTTTTVAPQAPSIALFLAGTPQINEGGTSYLWASYSNGTGVVDNGIGSLPSIHQHDVSPTVTTTYTLTVTNSAGQTASASVTITVIPTTTTSTTSTTTTIPSTSTSTTSTTTTIPVSSQVSITSQPANQTPTLGDSATFSVTATGTGALTYQWYRDGSAISGATSRTYVTDVEATYKVRVTNTLNGVIDTADSASRTLIVNAGALTPPNTNEYVTQGQSKSLWVSYSRPTGVTGTFQWTKDGIDISGATSNGYSASQTGDYQLVITCSRNGATKTLTSNAIHLTTVAMPVINSFDAVTSNIAPGGSTDLVPVFTGGSGVITPGNISVNSGDHVTVSPTTTTNFTLAVTNQAGDGPAMTYTITVTSGGFMNTANDSSVGRGSGSTSVALADGRVLVFGQYSGQGSVVTDIFDPAMNRFTRTGDSVYGLDDAEGIRLNNGKILVTGGVKLTTQWIHLDSAEVFDPLSGTWTQVGNMTSGRTGHFMVTLADGRVLVGGGNASKTVDIFNPTTNQFTRVADMPEVRFGALAAALPNGNVMVFGGSINGTATESTLLYDVTNNSWSYFTAHIPTPFKYGADIVTLNDGRILIAGGAYQDNTCMSAIQIFDPVTGTFNTSYSMSVRRCDLTIELLSSGKVLMIGGRDGYQSFNPIWSSVEVFDPTTHLSQIQANLMSSTRTEHSSAVLGDGRVLIIDGGAADQIFTQ